MATKPTLLPQWATDGGADIVEPSAGQKGDGWDVNDRPPAAYFNWWQNLTYQWTQYIDTPVGTGAGAGFAATGGPTNGAGVQGTGGGTSGAGLKGVGANHTTGTAGPGESSTGGTATTGVGGTGVLGTGGATSAGVGAGGAGLTGQGGASFGGLGGAGVVGTGGAGNGPGVQGFGVGNGCGVEGNGAVSPIGTAATTGSGVVGRGGQTNGFGGEFFGKGGGAGVKGNGSASPNSVGVYGVGYSGNAGVRGDGEGNGHGIVGNGGTAGNGGSFFGGNTDGTFGVIGSSLATNGGGLKGTGTGTGDGVYGLGVNGYGIRAESDLTTPAKAALRIVPQDTDPGTSPAAGDMYVHTTSGMPSVRTASAVWARLFGKVYNSTSATDTVTTATTFASTYAIPANTLRANSVVRISAAIAITVAGGAGNISFNLRIAGATLASTTVLVAATTGRHLLEAEFIVRSLGAPGSIASRGRGSCGADGLDGQVANKCNVIALDTTASRTIDVQAGTFSSASDTARLEYLMVEISD